MKINVALVLRLDDSVRKEFDDVTEFVEYYENLDEELFNRDIEIREIYKIEMELELKDGFYFYDDFTGNVRDIINLDNHGWQLENLSDMFHDLDDQEEMPELCEYLENDCEELQYYFSDITAFISAVQYGDYNIHDKYVKFNGYGNLITTNYIPYQDYEIEIFEQWINENI